MTLASLKSLIKCPTNWICLIWSRLNIPRQEYTMKVRQWPSRGMPWCQESRHGCLSHWWWWEVGSLSEGVHWTFWHLVSSKHRTDLIDQFCRIIKCLRARTESSPLEKNAFQFTRLFHIDYPISSSDTLMERFLLPFTGAQNFTVLGNPDVESQTYALVNGFYGKLLNLSFNSLFAQL